MHIRRPENYLSSPQAKRSYNRWLFGIVAKRYKTVTWVLSFCRDSSWKKWLVQNIPCSGSTLAVDIASGNGDIALRLRRTYPGLTVIASDLTREMIDPVRQNSTVSSVPFAVQDMSFLGFKNECADIITGGYALRNAPDLEMTLAEIRRVLKIGGTAAFLDFSKPSAPFAAALEYFLLKIWGNFWGLLFHARPQIYGYIAESLRVFPDRAELHGLLSKHNLAILRSKRFFFGIVEAVICRAKEDQPLNKYA
jgi:demethylmenaquinone methyltransferase/2-methoxy-6-polyprenyl-1,4-benzoquinol methylase